jgi:hypothetical protein
LLGGGEVEASRGKKREPVSVASATNGLEGSDPPRRHAVVVKKTRPDECASAGTLEQLFRFADPAQATETINRIRAIDARDPKLLAFVDALRAGDFDHPSFDYASFLANAQDLSARALDLELITDNQYATVAMLAGAIRQYSDDPRAGGDGFGFSLRRERLFEDDGRVAPGAETLFSSFKLDDQLPIPARAARDGRPRAPVEFSDRRIVREFVREMRMFPKGEQSFWIMTLPPIRLVDTPKGPRMPEGYPRWMNYMAMYDDGAIFYTEPVWWSSRQRLPSGETEFSVLVASGSMIQALARTRHDNLFSFVWDSGPADNQEMLERLVAKAQSTVALSHPGITPLTCPDDIPSGIDGAKNHDMFHFSDQIRARELNVALTGADPRLALAEVTEILAEARAYLSNPKPEALRYELIFKTLIGDPSTMNPDDKAKILRALDEKIVPFIDQGGLVRSEMRRSMEEGRFRGLNLLTRTLSVRPIVEDLNDPSWMPAKLVLFDIARFPDKWAAWGIDFRRQRFLSDKSQTLTRVHFDTLRTLHRSLQAQLFPDRDAPIAERGRTRPRIGRA